jgi:hypothetical protein
MRYSQILTLGLFGQVHPAYEININEAVKNGIIRHFDHITDLPSTQWYRVPQVGDTYKDFQQNQYVNSQACDQSTDDVEYTLTDPYEEDNTQLWPRIVSDLSWPQAEGTLLRNIYPSYMAIHGGARQFCVLRRYFAKTIDGVPDEPRDKEWGPYRCTHINPDHESYLKVISLRSGPHRKYKPIMNLVDIRSQADYFGPMHQQLALDSDEIKPIGKWQNNRPITNYTRNAILEKYNVKKFYNSEHEIFNDNSRLRLLAHEYIKMYNESRTGLMWEVDSMIPTYTIITGGPYETSVMTSSVDTSWVRRNLVPNYITRSHKGGFMRTGNILHDNNMDIIYAMDYPGYSRYCCTNSADGYEGYNPEDTRKKAVGYMFQPSFAPFFLALTDTTCNTETGETCQETYKPWYEFGKWGGDLERLNEVIQLKGPDDKYIPTASDEARAKLEQRDAKNLEVNLFVYLYSGNSLQLIKSPGRGTFEETFGGAHYNFNADFEKRIKLDNYFWKLDSYMFGDKTDPEVMCKSDVLEETIVTVNYQCSNNQYLRNVKEKKDATSYTSPYPDYQDAWSHPPYLQHIGRQFSGFAVDPFEMDKYFMDFEHFAPRFPDVDCSIPLNLEKKGTEEYGHEGQCEYNIIQPGSVEHSYAYNQYYAGHQRKHTISDIRQATPGDCTTIEVDVEVDCGSNGVDTELVYTDSSVKETNYWEYQPRCSAEAWDEIYAAMFQPKLNEADWGAYKRDELN